MIGREIIRRVILDKIMKVGRSRKKESSPLLSIRVLRRLSSSKPPSINPNRSGAIG
jgi:hypothetical protein